MDLQREYDEKENIVQSIDILIDEITDKDYIEQLKLIKYQAQNEMEEMEPRLQEEQDKEEREMFIDYEKEVI